MSSLILAEVRDVLTVVLLGALARAQAASGAAFMKLRRSISLFLWW
ncbi:MAG: hypothetical protein OEZ52_02105 [Candidatus Aminicenantes bacterium]|nr:hypothetical protein [Candidatus Aminicenantes bacterium]MDH5742317.1 hypothetical protein [Candidatus Aminicenantes bacterium]